MGRSWADIYIFRCSLVYRHGDSCIPIQILFILFVLYCETGKYGSGTVMV
jgi:hypothetical protein